jgi:hypothetical protein
MKKVFSIALIFFPILFFACSSAQKEIVNEQPRESDRPAPIAIWVTKGTPDAPIQIQVANQTMDTLEYLKVEIAFRDTMGEIICKIPIEVISPTWSGKGLNTRAFLRHDATDMYSISPDELASDCWTNISSNWKSISLSGKILEKRMKSKRGR